MSEQFYLIHSPEIPAGYTPLVYDESRGEDDISCTLKEGFTLVELGKEIKASDVKVPEGTKFAGVLWGDGKHFEDDFGESYGILGEVERWNSDTIAVYDCDGNEVCQHGVKALGSNLPAVLPPEAFGLKVKAAPWKKSYHWFGS